jgi:hypothetical protein
VQLAEFVTEFRDERGKVVASVYRLTLRLVTALSMTLRFGRHHRGDTGKHLPQADVETEQKILVDRSATDSRWSAALTWDGQACVVKE